ncbi:hypothetical protein SALBM135S_01673 [Streptomyces alboniger]
MARTAALSGPYEGLGHTGQLQDDPDALADMIVDGHLAGWQLAVHAIGDRAADLALDALERAQRLRPRPGARHRIEHAGLIRPDQLPRFAQLGVSAVVQPNFLRYFGDGCGDHGRSAGRRGSTAARASSTTASRSSAAPTARSRTGPLFAPSSSWSSAPRSPAR